MRPDESGRRRRGACATAGAPLAWLSMETGQDQADVHLTIWPGRDRRPIAQEFPWA